VLVSHWSMEPSKMALPSSQSARAKSTSRARISVLGLPPRNQELKGQLLLRRSRLAVIQTSLSDFQHSSCFLTLQDVGE
jgi:hypothetical protein